MRLTILLLVLLTASCGEPTDRPEDCDSNEYFDDARKLCFVCPAPTEPTCDLGCGITLTTDSRGCAAVECLVGDQCE